MFFSWRMDFLKLRPHRQQSVTQGINQKLAQRFFGPFQITEKIWGIVLQIEIATYFESTPSIPHFPIEESNRLIWGTTWTSSRTRSPTWRFCEARDLRYLRMCARWQENKTVLDQQMEGSTSRWCDLGERATAVNSISLFQPWGQGWIYSRG